MNLNSFLILLRKAVLLLAATAVAACSENGTTDTGDGGGNDGGTAVPHVVSSTDELSALGALKSGDVVIWKDGTYDAQQIVLTGQGTAGDPIVFRAETPGGVCFTGASSLAVDGSGICVSGFRWQDPEPAGEHLICFRSGSLSCRLEDCAVDGSGTLPDAENGTKWVSLYGSGHTVTHCDFENKRNMGALMVVWLEEGVTAGHTISYNRFTRPETIYDETDEPANEQETIRIGDSAHSMQEAHCIVEHNYFYRCNGEAQEIVSNKSCRNTYRGNGFFESKGTLTLRHGNDCTVSGNYFLGNDIEDTGGVRIIGEGHTVENNRFERLNSVGYKAALCLVRGEENPSLSGYFQVRNAVVRNNVFVDCNLAMHVNYGSSKMTLPVVSSRIENNTAVAAEGTTDYVVRYESSDPEAEIVWENNTFYGRFKNNYFGLSAQKERPGIPDGSAQLSAIEEAAGTTWE
ncbi:polysaccharide lyase 6 family protein [Gallalistipes aquisgranensis]|uniref:polysaccharide lyase 6 family protein n=1 Tax=Gallalistipes aquisgranensis TaxID=2779358 RepID=UPI001CF8AC8B|nr:polysaccharide lyase 6 family protein [Gallalistipes aquisgranensis]MBE5034433.1 polysaccharide lyase 6 family protein [Gallalistipes aquisgranensis]